MGQKEYIAENWVALLGEVVDQGLYRTLKAHRLASISWLTYLQTNPIRGIEYAQARAMRGELIADETITIADEDFDPQRARNRIDARKWLASKYKPETFGERLDVNVNQTVDIRGALTEAKSRAKLVHPVTHALSPATDNQSVAITPAEAKPSEFAADDPFAWE